MLSKFMAKEPLKLTRKEAYFNNILHVPEIRKNLISSNFLCKGGFKTILESDKLILSKNGVFFGKGYVCDGMFKLSVNFVVNNKKKNISFYWLIHQLIYGIHA